MGHIYTINVVMVMYSIKKESLIERHGVIIVGLEYRFNGTGLKVC